MFQSEAQTNIKQISTCSKPLSLTLDEWLIFHCTTNLLDIFKSASKENDTPIISIGCSVERHSSVVESACDTYSSIVRAFIRRD